MNLTERNSSTYVEPFDGTTKATATPDSISTSENDNRRNAIDRSRLLLQLESRVRQDTNTLDVRNKGQEIPRRHAIDRTSKIDRRR